MSTRISATEPFSCIGRSISEFITNQHLGLSLKIMSVASHVFCGLGMFFTVLYGFSMSLTSSLAIAGGATLTALFIQTVIIGYRIIKYNETLNSDPRCTIVFDRRTEDWVPVNLLELSQMSN